MTGSTDARCAGGGRVIWNTMVSLDGYVAGVGDAMDWAFAVDGGDGAAAAELIAGAGALLVGRRTMDVEDRLQPGFYGGAYSGPFWVLTSDPDRPPPVVKGVTGETVPGPIEQAVSRVKGAAAGRDVLVLGGTVARSVWDAGLLDEVVLFVAPIMLGGGIPLNRGPERRLDLLRQRREGELTILHLAPRRVVTAG